MEDKKVVVVDLSGFFGVFNSLTKRCTRNGCTETFIHGFDFEGGSLCRDCNNDFLDADQGQYESNATWAKCRKYVDADFQAFLKTPKSQTFTPMNVSYEDTAVTGYDIFLRNKPKVEVVSSSGTEEGSEDENSSEQSNNSSENSFDLRLKKIDEDFKARCRDFQDDPFFLTQFRAKLFYCSNDTLISLLRVAQAQALYHDKDKRCPDCENECDVLELSHHTRGLGTLWLETVKETYKDHEQKLNEIQAKATQ